MIFVMVVWFAFDFLGDVIHLPACDILLEIFSHGQKRHKFQASKLQAKPQSAKCFISHQGGEEIDVDIQWLIFASPIISDECSTKDDNSNLI